MGAKFSRLTDSIVRRTSRSSSTVDAKRVSDSPDDNVETGHDPAVHGARLEDRNYNNEAYKKRPVDPHEAQQRTAGATTIQTQFRQHASKEEVQAMRQEDAAIKIQSGFRGYIGREQVRQMKGNETSKEQEANIDIDLTCPEVEKAAIKIQSGFKGFKARKEAIMTQDEAREDNSRETPLETEDDSGKDLHDLDRAATKIQAGFRGHSARKQLNKSNENEPRSNNLDNQVDDDLQDIDLKDPDLSKAALKIQAGFRGLKSRKELQMKKELQKQEAEPKEEEVIDIDLDDPDVKKSALLIQAGFKGLKARKHLRQKAEEKQQEESEQKESQQDERQQDESQQDESQQDESQQDESQQEDKVHEEQKHFPEEGDQTELEADSAALKIQSVYRGYATRKSLKSTLGHLTPDPTTDFNDEDNMKPAHDDDEEEIDIDLNDPAVQKATLKLQAGFKGFKARKEMQAKVEEFKAKEAQNTNEENQEDGGDAAAAGTEDVGDANKNNVLVEDETGLYDDAKAKAVIKIQAGYRGMKAREHVKAVHESRKQVDKNEEVTEDGEEEGEHVFEEEAGEI